MFRWTLLVAALAGAAAPAESLFFGPKFMKVCVVSCLPKPRSCGSKARCYKKKKKSFGLPALLLAPLALPLVPPALFLGVVGAPVYGKDLLSGAGGLLDLANLEPRSTPNEYFVAPADMSPQFPVDGAVSPESSASVTTPTTGGGGGARRGPAPRAYAVPVAALEAAFLAMVKKQYTVALYGEPTLSVPGERRFVFVQRTPLLRFPDVINVQFFDAAAGDGTGAPGSQSGEAASVSSTLALHSGSVFGVDDLGKNRARANDWLARLDDELSETRTAAVFDKAEGKAAAKAGSEADTPTSALDELASSVVDSAAVAADALGDLVDAAAAPAVADALANNLQTPLRDLVATAVAAGNFTTLAAALAAAGLAATLQGPGPYTVLAPTDEAFAKLPNGTVEDWLKPENRAKLTAILTYHVLVGAVTAEDVGALNGENVETVNGGTLAVSVAADSGAVTVNGANVVATDVLASNGVIHVVDAVLLPPSP